jgi:hypothetical protein
MTEREMGWVSGLFEGEGYFGVRKRGNRYNAEATVGSNDKDVIEKLQKLLGYGYMVLKSSASYRKDHYRLEFGVNDALKLCEFLYDEMSERRKKQINRMRMLDTVTRTRVVREYDRRFLTTLKDANQIKGAG